MRVMRLANFRNSYATKQSSARVTMITRFLPGEYVSLPARPEWGLGQVQSAIGTRVTVMFEEAGKQTLDMRHAVLEKAPAPAAPRRR